MGYAALALVILVLLIVAIKLWAISLLIILAVATPRIIREIRKRKYFKSPEFLAKKSEIESVVNEHNEISKYVEEIRSSGRFTVGKSIRTNGAHLASSSNTSKFGYRRDRNVLDTSSTNVHIASLQVVRNASLDPIKYLIKYFDIDANEEKLSDIESMGESISKLENAIGNLKERESSISTAIAPPKFILKHYLKEFRAQIGLSVPEIQIPYPKYLFQYVSAGGNSSQETQIKLDSVTIDALIETLSEKIKFKNSAAGQRALMTVKFREYIKNRDKYSCQICDISIRDEEHLLLEVDHIKPVSKGGLSVESNLQTLCWKCNRTKSNKDSL
jgi:hypothetical protein